MGADFVEKATQSFAKAWDKGLLELGTSDLLTSEPGQQPRCGVVTIGARESLHAGDRVTVESVGDGLAVRSGIRTVGHYASPTPEMLAIVRDSSGIADGVVEVVHETAGVAEVSVC